MPQNIVIIGAVALGPKAACRFKRLEPDSKVIMVDRDNLISYILWWVRDPLFHIR